MRGKLSLLIGFGAGYVLGARAGHQRYEQIASTVQGVWTDPRVQEKVHQGEELIREKAGEAGAAASAKASEAGTKVADTVKEKLHSDAGTNGTGASTTPPSSGPGTTPSTPSGLRAT